MPIKLIASDLDGTLVDHNNFIPNGNLIAIEDINKKNIDFAICTGKTYSITKNICDKCNASYGIFGNGTQIINLKTGEEIYKNFKFKTKPHSITISLIITYFSAHKSIFPLSTDPSDIFYL